MTCNKTNCPLWLCSKPVSMEAETFPLRVYSIPMSSDCKWPLVIIQSINIQQYEIVPCVFKVCQRPPRTKYPLVVLQSIDVQQKANCPFGFTPISVHQE